MNIFKSETLIPVTVDDLGPVAEELAGHFKQRNYQVECSQTDDGHWEVGITRGGIFKTVVGLKSALKVQIEARPRGTMVRAGAGIFGKQAAASAISLFAAWPIGVPVLLAQAWGLIREAGLDNEAARVVELSLTRTQRLAGPSGRTEAAAAARTPEAPQARAESPGAFCTGCGRRLEEDARFCAGCGKAVQAAAAAEPSA